MHGLEKDTIGGFNRVLEENAAADGECNITTLLFSSDVHYLHDRIPVKGVHLITDRDYQVGGSTALLDAMGSAMLKMERIIASTDEAYRPGHVQFVIITDGYENASRKFSREQIRSMVTCHQERDNWDFLFLGADMDAISVAESYGIHPDRAVSTISDSQSVEMAYGAVIHANMYERSSSPSAPRTAAWKQDVEQDTKSRSRQ